ncbi:MAG: hypothetical protein ACRC9R_09880, partial [Enterovibrio sp.]
MHRDDITQAAVNHTTMGHVPLPAGFDPRTMLTQIPRQGGLTDFFEIEIEEPVERPRRDFPPAERFGPRPSQQPCPAGYEDYFGHAVLGRPVNLEREPFLLQTALEAAGLISGDIDDPQNGDLIIPVPPQEGPRDNLFAMLDRNTTYMVPFYRTRPQVAGEPHEWRTVVLLQFVNNEWHYFSSQYGPTTLTTNNGRTISPENLHIYFNPEARLPLNSAGQPYIQLFTMTPERFRDILGINHRLQNSLDVNAELTALIGLGELIALPHAGRGGRLGPDGRPIPPARPGTAASGAAGFTPNPLDPRHHPLQPPQAMYQFMTQPQDVTHTRPAETPYLPVDRRRYRHLPGASCVDESLEFLSQHFGLPAPQWPDAANVRNRGGIDFVEPLIIGQAQGILSPWPLGQDSFETRETDPARIYNFLDTELDRECAYLLFTENSARYGNAHTVALYFDYEENEWFVFNNTAINCNGLPVKITDTGNLTTEGRDLLLPAARQGLPQRRLHFYAMDNERTEYMCEMVRRERLRAPTDVVLDPAANIPQRYLAPVRAAQPVAVAVPPGFDYPYQFSTPLDGIQQLPPANNLH